LQPKTIERHARLVDRLGDSYAVLLGGHIHRGHLRPPS
jgi:hypothetical protein